MIDVMDYVDSAFQFMGFGAGMECIVIIIGYAVFSVFHLLERR